LSGRELLVEIGCEELPASWLPGLSRQLAERTAVRLAEARLAGAPPEAYSTPRRLVVVASHVAERQDDLEETVTGPPLSAAVGRDGLPSKAGLGFARKLGVDFADLDRIETPKGTYVAGRRREPGRAAVEVLPDLLAAILRDLTFPKQMRWDARLEDGRGDLLFGRPIRWLLLLYGEQVVPLAITRTTGTSGDGVREVIGGRVTYGHRFQAASGLPGVAIPVTDFTDYRRKLAEHCVILDRGERRDRISRALEARAEALGGRVLVAEGSTLLDEVPDLVEYPGVVAGGFDPGFLTLPDEVLITTMIHHQHYFPVVTDGGRLTRSFLAVTNLDPRDERPIAVNAERVLTARLRDAGFFWDSDRRTPLGERLDRLDTVLFHRQLGSYRAKAERLAGLSAWIARAALHCPDRAAAARRAGLLAKADLTTGMVGEFPELQGVMGGIYAREEGEPESVWRAIYAHYLPVAVEVEAAPSSDTLGAGADTWAAVSLADKLDTIVGLFSAGERPTGSRDPLGLRRQAHGALRVLVDLERLTGVTESPDLGSLVSAAAEPFGGLASWDPAVVGQLVAFLTERLEYLLQQRGFDVRNVRAVVRGRDLAALRPAQALRKLEVLPEFTESADFTRLAVAFKRVRNIARELPDADFDAAERETPSLDPWLVEPAERDLAAELDRRRPVIDAAVAAGRGYREAFAEAAKFGPSVDRFFTEVFVMVEDPLLKTARLRLMKRLERLVLQLADVSEIVPQPES
jgi:glycyl-tRNA synthetase beta chain